jgi:hypothetical protein
MTKKQHTSKGQPITDEQIEKLAAEAEAGYDIEKLRRRGGRKLLGSAAARVVPSGSTPN